MHARLQTLSAVVTALAALVALIVIPLQIRANDRLQQAQSARDIYRDFLNLTIQRPEIATTDICTTEDPARRLAYEAYVDHLLYTAEQVLGVSAEWEPVMSAALARHQTYLCTWDEAELVPFSPALASLLNSARHTCPTAPPCP
jgi:hypothetical protein